MTAHRTERNMAPYQTAAADVVDQLAARGFAEIILQPGDATAYRFVILPDMREVVRVSNLGEDSAQTDPVNCANFLVILAAGFGASYDWLPGQGKLSWDYCAQKWTPNGNEWTGRVVALFLNHIADQLALQ
jgi:hypothetical protein